jgi:hypothetical protein
MSLCTRRYFSVLRCLGPSARMTRMAPSNHSSTAAVQLQKWKRVNRIECHRQARMHDLRVRIEVIDINATKAFSASFQRSKISISNSDSDCIKKKRTVRRKHNFNISDDFHHLNEWWNAAIILSASCGNIEWRSERNWSEPACFLNSTI